MTIFPVRLTDALAPAAGRSISTDAKAVKVPDVRIDSPSVKCITSWSTSSSVNCSPVAAYSSRSPGT
jgi:hypothetical protein